MKPTRWWRGVDESGVLGVYSEKTIAVLNSTSERTLDPLEYIEFEVRSVCLAVGMLSVEVVIEGSGAEEQAVALGLRILAEAVAPAPQDHLKGG